jgi:hypothetical protein
MSNRENYIVRKILDDLLDRNGLRNAWEEMDDDIQEEAIEAWRAIVRTALADHIQEYSEKE